MEAITKEHLKELQAEIEIQGRPLNDELKAAKQKYHKACDELEKPYHEMENNYFDQELRLKDGGVATEGLVIKKSNKTYLILKRRMRYLFGEAIGDPHAVVVKLGGRIEKNLYKSDLKEYEVI